ncbi:serine hydrolase domain-containing protein [Kutzneria albida]|uniref:Beta-lactamase-related domain-containing protein n=1 Tax=Kutzneria albida DSM 43870 TaxID=1449976 RepID=W5WJV9_9PSEU|nr:serine hydrolase domain-containing protein [Kutzneria albida]AHH98464.1 hypothetical protein KALB_5102 [Kutzneria albida DSM 43870]
MALETQADPVDLGFDPERLRRVDSYLARYVDRGLLAGTTMAISRDQQLAHVSHLGFRDREAGLPVDGNTQWRIYSMTKPVTSVAAMTLYEQGAFDLNDPISRWLPEFADMRVYAAGAGRAARTVPAVEPIRVWHLLTHTAGLTYGFHHAHAVDEMYREAGFEADVPPGMDLAGACRAWAELPLVHQPGTEWNYSVATDVLGRLVEVLSGQPLDEYFAKAVFDPLGMTDTAFWSDSEDLAALYVAAPDTGKAVPHPAVGQAATRPPTFLSGGGGLVSTAADYHRFTQMLLRRGELDGVRVLGPRTVDLMRANHLPGGADLEAVGRPLFSESPFAGTGFGLGFSVLLDPVAAKCLAPAGEYAWGGAASTAFWVDPVERITALFFTQLLPSSLHPIRQGLRQLVYQALI